ncbi:MAG: hypothetical protein CMI18_04855 [Opitutaceae bacterium]|nr:hypothetical protein [Opitutaceae bacterium]
MKKPLTTKIPRKPTNEENTPYTMTIEAIGNRRIFSRTAKGATKPKYRMLSSVLARVAYWLMQKVLTIISINWLDARLIMD